MKNNFLKLNGLKGVLTLFAVFIFLFLVVLEVNAFGEPSVSAEYENNYIDSRSLFVLMNQRIDSMNKSVNLRMENISLELDRLNEMIDE